ncbi:FemAB family PEP-CTERM system-associated protein [soil metagenome]
MNAAFDPTRISIEEARLDDAAATAVIDAWICARPDSTPFHRPAWIAAVTRGTGQRAIMLVARDIAGQIVGVLPLTAIRSLLFGKAMVSSGFAVGGGILANSQRATDALADACWAMAGQAGCASAELRGGREPQGWTTKAGTYLGFAQPMEVDGEAQLRAMPKRHRAEVRKGLGNGLDFEIGDDARLRAIHYRLYARNVHRLGTPVFPKALFDEVLNGFGDAADIAVVTKDGVPLSSVLSLCHGDTVMPYWQGGAEAARAARSNELLYYRLMDAARERGLTRFDFGRSKVGTGPAAYKKNWGFTGVPLAYFGRTVEGQAGRDVNPLSPQYSRKVELWKKLPLPVANLIGPWLARGLG